MKVNNPERSRASWERCYARRPERIDAPTEKTESTDKETVEDIRPLDREAGD